MDRVVRNDDIGRQTANHNFVRVGSQTDQANLLLQVLGQWFSHMDGTVVERGKLWWVVFFQKITVPSYVRQPSQQPAGYFMLYFCIFRASNGLLHVVSKTFCFC